MFILNSSLCNRTGSLRLGVRFSIVKMSIEQQNQPDDMWRHPMLVIPAWS